MLNYSNCSLYYLPHGHVRLYDTSNDLIRSGNITIPSLYVTNCSANYSDVYDYYSQIWNLKNADELLLNDSFDSFRGGMISILFAFSAIVVSSWMMLLVLYLSSNKKPISIKIASLIYSISVTVILDRTTKLMEHDSKKDIQDIAHFQETVINGLYYLILLLISQLATWIAWLDIVVYIMPVNYLKKAARIGLGMIFLNILLVSLDSFYLRDRQTSDRIEQCITILTIISQLLIQISFVILVISYTIRNNDMAYNIHTLPLALVTLPMMATPFVFYLTYNYADTLQSWSGLFYTFGQIVSSSLIWEWIFDIELISKEVELNGIVGREIELSFTRGSSSSHMNISKNRYKRGGNWFKLTKTKTDVQSVELAEGEGYELNNISIPSSSDEYYNNDDIGVSIESRSNVSFSLDVNSDEISSITSSPINSHNNNNIHVDELNHSEVVQAQGQVSSTLSLPPDFEPHPNFNTGDYWIDEKRYTRHNE